MPFLISMFDNWILCCSSRVPFQLRCPFKPTFRRDRKEVLFPSPDSYPPRYLYASLSRYFFSFFLFFHSFPRDRKKKREAKKIRKPSLWNWKLNRTRRRRKKKKIAFSLLLSDDDGQTRGRRLRKQGEASLLGWRFFLHRLDSIMKPCWSDGWRNTNRPLCLSSASQLSRLALVAPASSLPSFSFCFVFARTRRIDEQMEGEIKRVHNYLNGVVDTVIDSMRKRRHRFHEETVFV